MEINRALSIALQQIEKLREFVQSDARTFLQPRRQQADTGKSGKHRLSGVVGKRKGRTESCRLGLKSGYEVALGNYHGSISY